MTNVQWIQKQFSKITQKTSNDISDTYEVLYNKITNLKKQNKNLINKNIKLKLEKEFLFLWLVDLLDHKTIKKGTISMKELVQNAIDDYIRIKKELID